MCMCVGGTRFSGAVLCCHWEPLCFKIYPPTWMAVEPLKGHFWVTCKRSGCLEQSVTWCLLEGLEPAKAPRVACRGSNWGHILNPRFHGCLTQAPCSQWPVPVCQHRQIRA